MDIIGALKADSSQARVTCGNAWLYWDETTNEWIVLERKFGARKNTELYRGADESKAVAAMTGTEER